MPFLALRFSARLRVLLFAMAVLVGGCATPNQSSLPVPVALSPQGAQKVTSDSPANQPAFYPFLPSPANNTGAGILIVPGESFPSHNPDPEGRPTARWLNEHGIAAFVLSYRIGTAGGSATNQVSDINSALQYLHTHAADFHLSATRIGLLGFGPGAVLAANAAFANSAASPTSSDSTAHVSIHPDFLALIYGAALPPPGAAIPPPTFLVGSTDAQDNISVMIDLWNRLRSRQMRVPVEAHFFPKVDVTAGLAEGDVSLGAWPGLFYNWVRADGFLTDLPRVAIHGSVSLDGRPLPFGYLILTPVGTVGAGPIVAHVFNSTQGVPIGSFSVPAAQGPVPGRYRVDVRQNANRWLSNAFSADLIRDPAFGHARILSPSIDDQHSYTKVHPDDNDEITVDIKPDENPDLNIKVFSK